MKKTARQAFGTICIVYSVISLITLPSSLFDTKPIFVLGVIVYALLCIAWGFLGIVLIRKAKLIDSPKPELSEKILSWGGAVFVNAVVFTLFITPIWNKLAFKTDPNLSLLIASTPIGDNSYLALRNDSLYNIQKIDDNGFTTFHFKGWYKIKLESNQLIFLNPFNAGANIPIETGSIIEYNDSTLRIYCLNKSSEILEAERIANQEKVEREKREQEKKRAMFKLSEATLNQIEDYLYGRWKVRLDLGVINGSAESICYYIAIQGSLITVKKRYCERYRNEYSAPEELVYHGRYSLIKGAGAKWVTDNVKSADTDVLYLRLNNTEDITLYIEQDRPRYLDDETFEPVSFVGQYGTNWSHFSRED